MVAPWASPSRRGSASAWIETNSAADRVARDFDPVGERDEGVVGAGHDHAIFAAFLDAIAQRIAKSSTRVLFHSRRAAWVPLSMPPWPGSITTSGRDPAAAAGFAARRPHGNAGGFWRPRSAGQSGGFQGAATGRSRCDRPLRVPAPAAAAGRWRPPAHRNWRSSPDPSRSNTMREPPGITRP